ncbi:hypothetical protein [Rhizobium esperanzae]|uniref:Uncharacterized protein n=1 Tax=Rhizobium esperanzae TaxID=1967781 RepID=A0A7W6W411_9HYPH|nr:hypothetical protein [Rhizobium esperanzae]MBB4235094.1 hypothetical protein [Rhizobium esperanzae]
MNATARRVTGARSESIRSAGQRIYDDAGRNSEAAIEALILEIRKRPALHEDAFRIAATTIVAGFHHQDNAKVKRGDDIGTVHVPTAEVANDAPVVFTPQSAASVKASNAAFKRFAVTLTGLYLFKIKDGNGGEFLLGQATPDQLRAAEAHYRAQGSTMVRTARWLEKIIACSRDNMPIHQSLNLKEIERMKDDAFNSEV